ncbi:transcriptional regulator, partial [Klebsiella pneumoniae]|nr:transcriptional regulator [Klebsiella pneumoniae]
HLGGSAGSALMTLFLPKGWITRAPGSREVQVTDSGKAALSRLCNLKVSG